MASGRSSNKQKKVPAPRKRGNVGTLQKGRQQGSNTGGEAFKSNSLEFFRHPGQGMRGEEGGKREAERSPTPGSDTRKHTRPPNER